MINLIFGSRGTTAGLAYVDPHCVTGIALPPVDASNLCFSLSFWPLCEGIKNCRVGLVWLDLTLLSPGKSLLKCVSVVRFWVCEVLVLVRRSGPKNNPFSLIDFFPLNQDGL